MEKLLTLYALYVCGTGYFDGWMGWGVGGGLDPAYIRTDVCTYLKCCGMY